MKSGKPKKISGSGNFALLIAVIIAFCMLILLACSLQNSSENATSTANEGAYTEALAEDSKSTVSESAEEDSSLQAFSANDLLSQIKERGEITIAMEGTWAPWTYHDEDDNLVGYDVEIGQEIADSLGVKATFIEARWDGLLAGLDSGRYDLMINGVGVTEERSQAYDFSDPYAFDRMVVIVTGDNNDINSMEDLAGKHTANTISSTYAAVAERYGAEVTGVDDLNQTFELLLAGRIDATLNAEVTFYDYTKAHPDANVKIACVNPEVTSVAIPFRKSEDTASLREAINQILADMRESGKLASLSVKYFGTDITNPVTVQPG